MKWKLRIPEPAMVVYYLAKSTGHAPFIVKNGIFYPPSYLDHIYSICLALITVVLEPSVILSLSALKINLIVDLPQIVKIAISMYRVIRSPIIFLNLMIFLSKHKRILLVMKKLSTISNELNNLGIKEDRDKFFKHLIIVTLMTFFAVVVALVALGFMDPIWSVLFTIEYSIHSYFHTVIVLIFTQMLFFIRQRFTLINKKMYELFESTGRLRSPLHHSISVVRENLHEEFRPDIEHLIDFQSMRKIEALHLELCRLVDQTTQLFSISFLLKSLQSTAELMTHCFWIYNCLKDSQQVSNTVEANSLLVGVSCSVIRIAILICQLFTIAHAPATTCDEGNAMRAVLSKVWYKFKSQKLHEELVMFSLQLNHKPVAVSLFGIINLDYSYLYQITCAMVAYSIVMIQFDKSHLNPGT